MKSDSTPQPRYDSDFGPGMEYESGDRSSDTSEADKIRQEWKKTEGKKPTRKAEPKRPKDQEGVGL